MRNQSENNDIQQKPVNLKFSDNFNFYFAFLTDMIEEIITLSPYSP